MSRLRDFIRDNILWLVAAGLMASSSGIDGAYMASWMPPGLGWLGLVLNIATNVAVVALMFSYGRLRRESAKNSKRYRMARWLLAGESLAIGYAAFFGWRQLRVVMTHEPEWVAALSALFIPLLIAFVGYAQALSTDAPEEAQPAQPARNVAQPVTTAAPAAASVAQPAPVPAPVARRASDNGATPRNGAAQFDSKSACIAHYLRNDVDDSATLAQLCDCSDSLVRSVRKRELDEV
jgi:hypothetical protein